MTSMDNRVDDFIAGVEATFGHLAQSSEELASCLKAARRFYLEFIGAQDSTTSTQTDGELPFWRYLIFYSTLALDHAASASAETDKVEEQRQKELASELSSCWPLLGMLVSPQYAHSAVYSPTQRSEAGSPKEPNDAQAGEPSNDQDRVPRVDAETIAYPRPLLHRHASIPRAIEPVTSPLSHTGDISVESETTPLSQQPDFSAASWDGYVDRPTGRSLSESTQFTNSSASTYPSEVLATPPRQLSQSFFAVNDDYAYPVSAALGHTFASTGHPSRVASDEQSRLASEIVNANQKGLSHDASDARVPLCVRGDGTDQLPRQRGVYEPSSQVSRDNILLNPEEVQGTHYRGSTFPTASDISSKPLELSTRVLLADRGDNTAKLVPTGDGAYVLDVSIGGRKLIIKPERPAEVQYHDHQGHVVTQSLFPSGSLIP